MRLMPFFALLAVLVCAPAYASVAMPEGEVSVVAVVNNDIITSHDVMQRLRLVMAMNNLSDTKETREHLLPQITRSLTDEVLKLQEVRRQNIRVRSSEKEKALEQMMESNPNIGDLDSFLTEHQLPRSSLDQQLESQLGWTKLVMTRLRSRVNVTEGEVEDTLKQMAGEQSRREYQLQTIVLPVNDPEQEEDVRNAAQQLVTEIRGGADFGLLQEQFAPGSATPSNSEPVWMAEARMDTALRDVVGRMNPGSVSPPVRTGRGYEIVRLVDQRNVSQSDPDESEVSLHQLTVPVRTETEDAMNDAYDQILLLHSSIKNCGQLEAVPTLSRDVVYHNLGRVQLKSLHKKVREMVRPLGVNQMTEPFRTPEGFQLLMVCEKINAATTLLPDDEMIRQMLTQQKLELQATQYLRNLRREAYIEYRI